MRKSDEERVFFEKKKRFHPFRRHLQQNWTVENMSMLPGHFVFISIEKNLSLNINWDLTLGVKNGKFYLP